MGEPESQELSPTIESTLKPTSIEATAKYFNVVFIHSIRPDILAGQNNRTFTERTYWTQKLENILNNNPEIAASTVKQGDTSENMWGPMGVVLRSGDIIAADRKDAASIVDATGSRDTVQDKSELELLNDIGSAIITRPPGRYNELIIKNPSIAGLYMARDPLADYSINNKNYAGIAPRISDKEMYEASLRYKLPLFLIKDGKVFKAGFDENDSKLIPFEEINSQDIVQSK